MRRTRLMLGVMTAATLMGGPAARSGTPVIPPAIVDMKVIGRLGSYTSGITSDLLLNGNHLYCSTIWGGGLKTLDVSDPANMVLTSDWTDGGGGSGQAYGLAVKGTVLYMANWAPGNGLRVFSIADPAHPSLIRTVSTTAHTWDLAIAGNLLFVTISNGIDPPTGIAGVNVYDISTPSNPVLKSFVASTRRLVGRSACSGSYLYMISTNWLDVYNLANPASPVFVRRLTFNARTGTGFLEVKGGYLYMAADDDTYPDPDWLDGGLYVFSLADPSFPQQVEFYESPVSKDLHLQGTYGIIPAGGNGLHGMDVSDPLNVTQIWHVGMEWPGTGPGGYEECALGAGDYAFIGTVESNSCTDCGARVYAVRIQVAEPPVIREVVPDPGSIFAGQAYSKQLTLLQGTPLPAWSVVQGPRGAGMNSNGLLSGWTPAAGDIGTTVTFCVRATNVDGSDDECWLVRVNSIVDFDHDDDVDQDDFGHLQRCLSGAYAYPPECQNADLDGNGYIEDADLTVFLMCIGGANRPPGC